MNADDFKKAQEFVSYLRPEQKKELKELMDIEAGVNVKQSLEEMAIAFSVGLLIGIAIGIFVF